MALWRIEIVRAKLELLGTIEAADLAEAVVKAMAEFNIPEERRNRLIVQKIGSKGLGRWLRMPHPISAVYRTASLKRIFPRKFPAFFGEAKHARIYEFASISQVTTGVCSFEQILPDCSGTLSRGAIP